MGVVSFFFFFWVEGLLGMGGGMEMDWDALFAAGADIVDVVVFRCCTCGWRGRWLWIGR